MAKDRSFSTRELAQMWNVSESTVKRWADAGKLPCTKTPGGHRKFWLKDISSFQLRQGFEATGLLTTEQWEDPELELWVNQKNLRRVVELITLLARENQRHRVRAVLERLYMRGMRLEDIYDDVIFPVFRNLAAGDQLEGQVLLITNNLEEALSGLFSQIVRKRCNGKTALCAAPTGRCRLKVNAIARLLEIEGWETLNLGARVPYRAMAELVIHEPVNMVCVVSNGKISPQDSEDYQLLDRTADEYRIPILWVGHHPNMQTEGSGPEFSFVDFRSFQDHLRHL
ncbi:MAG TPA: helix-turn-helix domain-containing protein [Acidobacteriota bacterium]|nr:helix-turn-helix domain-containing protein [Acidobacteriota bacterium]